MLCWKSTISLRRLIEGATARDITIMCINPTLLNLLIEFVELNGVVITNFRKIYVSGAVVSPVKIRRAERLFGECEILNAYGLTEAGPRVAMQTKGSTCGSVGKLLNNVKVKLLEVRTRGEKNKIGRILVNTPTAFIGYINSSQNESEWIDTKDLGYWGNDGELFVIGRDDDVIIKSGCNVFPETIEDIILGVSGVSDCCVFGCPSDRYGEKIVCLYTMEKDIDSELFEKDIRRICCRHLLLHEIPDTFMHVDTIIRNSNGKIDKKKNIQIYKEKKQDG